MKKGVNRTKKMLKNVGSEKNKNAIRMRSHTDNDTDNDIVNGNGNDTDTVTDNDNGHIAAAMDANKDAEDTSAQSAAAEKPLKKPRLKNTQAQTVCLDFNKIMADCNIPKLVRISAARRELVQNIWQEHSYEEILTVFRKAANSAFLNGRTKKKFLATFEWLMQEENFLHVLEGNFNV